MHGHMNVENVDVVPFIPRILPMALQRVRACVRVCLCTYLRDLRGMKT